jgi:hypothetical protein
MPTFAVLVVRLRELPDGGDLNRWRRDLLASFEPGDFSHDGPLQIVRDAGHGPVPVADGSIWLDVGTIKSYYGEGYERGDAEYMVRLAEWLESNIPNSEVWYGHDVADESIKPFGAEQRDAFLDYFRKVGHEPWDSKFCAPGGPTADTQTRQRTGAADKMSWFRRWFGRGPRQ